MNIDTAYQTLYSIVLILFLLLIGAAIIRSVNGPRATVRIMCVNMTGTMVISCIALLSCMLGEAYLCDVALIYAMLSFLSVLMLASMFIPPRSGKHPFDQPAKKKEPQNADAPFAQKGGEH